MGFTGDAYKPGLDGMLRFSAVLGDPWKAYPCVHVAGTNGKGSVCSLLASALAAGGAVLADGHPRRAKGTAVSRKGSPVRALPVRLSPNGPSGRRIGLYTSPHLLDFRERMKIVSGDGFEMISREEVWEFLCLYEEAFEGLSFFEITTGMAFWWFARQGVDAAVIETGLGGRLDSTNIITPVLSVVTSIGLDHCALLGSTRALIAREKAGIFKPGVPAVVGVRDAETAPVFEEVAASVGTPLVFASDVPACGFEQDLLSRMDLTGPCQDLNLHTVLVALAILENSEDLGRIRPKAHQVAALEGGPGAPEAENAPGGGLESGTWGEKGPKCTRSVLNAIAEAGKRTGLWGRWQRICEKPEVICDIGHNPPALKENFARLEALANGEGLASKQPRTVIIIYGIMADKDLAGIAPLMPAKAKYILAAPDNQRAMRAEELAARLKALRPDLDCRVSERPVASKAEAGRDEPAAEACREGSVAAAVRQALDLAQDLPNALIYIGGSTFVVAEALPLFNKTTEL
ncbi:MAG: hypothetical protein IJL22_06055 [Bacteroidales bacterium]|nr:hypothetical protein [Bacteroidales bacterium]